MSLKIFHVIFIVCAIILTIGFAFWAATNFRQYHTAGYLWTAIISLACAGGLIVYEIQVANKIED